MFLRASKASGYNLWRHSRFRTETKDETRYRTMDRVGGAWHPYTSAFLCPCLRCEREVQQFKLASGAAVLFPKTPSFVSLFLTIARPVQKRVGLCPDREAMAPQCMPSKTQSLVLRGSGSCRVPTEMKTIRKGGVF